MILSNLPLKATPSFVASLVYGGNLEQIRMIGSGDKAYVRFLDPSECRKFYDDSDNGLVYGKYDNGKEKVVWVTLQDHVDVIGGNLREQIARGCTRCVKVVPVDEDYTMWALETFARGHRRNVESVSSGRSTQGNVDDTLHTLLLEIH